MESNGHVLAVNLALSVVTVVLIPAGGFLVKKWIDGIQDSAVLRTTVLKDDIDKLQRCMNSVKEGMREKVDKEDCKERCDEKWERLNHHSHDSSGRVIVI
jgi:hypothetical protein